MRDAGITPLCDQHEFLATAEARLSESVREEVGDVMYEGDPIASYEEWHLRLQEWVKADVERPRSALRACPVSADLLGFRMRALSRENRVICTGGESA